MNAEQRLRNVAEHFLDLLFGHGRVSTDGGQDVGEAVAVVLPRKPSQVAGKRVEAGDIGRHGDDFAAGFELAKGGLEPFLQSLGIKRVGFRPATEVQHRFPFFQTQTV